MRVNLDFIIWVLFPIKFLATKHCDKTIHPTFINTGEEHFKWVNYFKYLGTMVNIDNSIEEEIKERIAAGNRAYHVHKKTFHQN